VYPDKSFLNINSKSFNNDLRVHLSLTLAFDPPLSNDGGELSVVGWEYWTYYDEGSGIAIGQVVAIPEPAETVFLAVYLTGLVGFCMARAQKKIFVT